MAEVTGGHLWYTPPGLNAATLWYTHPGLIVPTLW